MSYQVLARKWRPKSFSSLVGQDHVVQALSNALSQQRLHHAYLFTGTRGVGKTTLSRILAKSLNCATGITATPCGTCEACLAIDIGRYVDYVEMDAASNRGIADMVSLLEQAIYAPSSGRFKVYMIDEVHMLTKEAFNAMLKTLEEPPAHVKFILATTDPQKVPVTILSRCLQFNLRQMASSTITAHLQDILGQEQLPFEAPALQLIARAANGSMRDALSLTDQAIAYGNQSVRESDVRSMLGAIDQSYLYELLHALIASDATRLLHIAQQMESRSIGFESALNDLAALLHLLAVAQYSPQAIADDHPERQTLLDLASQLSAEMLQLYYQICILGHRDIGLAPDAYAGFTMTLLRLLAFKADAMTPSAPTSSNGGSSEGPSRSNGGGGARAALANTRQMSASESNEASQTGAAAIASAPVIATRPAQASTPAAPRQAIAALEQIPQQSFSAPIMAQASESAPVAWDGNWRGLVENHLSKLGLVRALAQNCELVSFDADTMTLRISEAHKHLASANYLDKLNSALSSHFGRRLKLNIVTGQEANTPARQQAVEKAELQDQATEAIMADRFVQGLMQEMGATIIPNSIKPLH
ncbi:DNA polymerase III subunit gamma/tau [Methylophilus medardicus]|uniref:DNA polymerase III subunit gamma/tau n=1 Tax=Methylophilus medardicus TaxID=2588534 RepID=A0A5B8CRW9_9PROT|nr:DNA polymerase III subunit gamma/tau [Methylophilus medardicus]QDC44054.1 DNA polymerase III subunit gamma/tau [Methylophilus medardicus]QDC49061.1 DNA polymerase III subunit gamma/tau [Methylophilus medardicus]QDC52766.1 DNA polymerase III subunit gamma/tau [Methylophilus medardicus]